MKEQLYCCCADSAKQSLRMLSPPKLTATHWS